MPGLREVLRRQPSEVAREWLGDSEERIRRGNAALRTRLYQDDSERAILDVIRQVFADETVRAKLARFASVAKSQALFRRIVDEKASPVYSVPPVRTVAPPTAQPAFDLVAKETRLDEVMDLACRLAWAHNDVALYPRYIAGLRRIRIEILTPDVTTVIPHPDDPCIPLAIIYDKAVRVGGRWVTWHVYWDDAITFTLDEGGAPVRTDPTGIEAGLERAHGLPRMPFAWVHRRARWRTFWDSTSGSDLVAAQIQCAILQLLALRLLKAQGFKQIVLTGDIQATPANQALDEESAILVPEGAQLSTVDLKSEASHYLALIEAIKLDASANNGLSRARMNQEKAESSSDDGLLEKRAEGIRFMGRAEADLFEVVQMVSTEHDDPAKRIPEGASLRTDFGEWELRTDRKAQLEIWETEQHMGLRSPIDNLKASQPDVRTDDEAAAKLQRNIDQTAAWVAKIRALNQPADASVDKPGQDAAANGAMGPAVRDGRMTKDAAAKAAKGDLRALARRVLDAR